MIKINVLRKCGHLERLTYSLGVTDLQLETQRIKEHQKLCLNCLTNKRDIEIEQHRAFVE